MEKEISNKIVRYNNEISRLKMINNHLNLSEMKAKKNFYTGISGWI